MNESLRVGSLCDAGTSEEKISGGGMMGKFKLQGLPAVALNRILGKVFVVWCSSGCTPYVFSAKKDAEAFAANERVGHFNVDEIIMDAGTKGVR